MKFFSTRSKDGNFDFRHILFSGYSSDGGLFVPSSIPSISHEILKLWSTLSYTELVLEILSLFISEDEIPRKILNDLIKKGLGSINHPSTINMVSFDKSLNIFELYHGPTFVFKDLSMSVIAELMEYFLQCCNDHATILISTSGDTGGSAIEFIKHKQNLDLIVFLPKDRCTKIQELQMTTVDADNVHVFCVDGDNDEILVPMTKCLKDKPFVKERNLCSINSINLARVIIQSAHYFYGYLKLAENIGDVVEYVVPTGAAGNLAGGVLAAKIGLPIRLVAACNKNDVFNRIIVDGEFSMREVEQTMAVAMNIQDVYNVERILYLLSDGDVKIVRDIMEQYERQSFRVNLPLNILTQLRALISSHVASDDDIKETMVRCFHDNSYLVCPHSATAVHYHYTKSRSDNSSSWQHCPRICIATAAPEKFPEIYKQLQLDVKDHAAINGLFKKPTYSKILGRTDNWEDKLRETIDHIHERYEPGFTD